MSEKSEMENSTIKAELRQEPMISWPECALIGGLASIGVMALNSVADRILNVTFIPFDIFDWIARILPGSIITAMIDSIVLVLQSFEIGPTDRVAKVAERGFALIFFLLLGAVLGVLIGALKQRWRWGYISLGIAVGMVLGSAAIFVRTSSSLLFNYSADEAIWVLLLFTAFATGIAYLLHARMLIEDQNNQVDFTRRSFFYWVGGVVLTAALGSIGLNEFLDSKSGVKQANISVDVDLSDTSGMAASPSEGELANRIEPAQGTRPEITANENFYKIDINASFQPLNENSWRLEIGGLVNNPLSLTLADLRSRPSVSQAITLQCISNPIGGDLTGTTKWTGVRLADLMEEADPIPGVKELAIESADGFYESVGMGDVYDPRTLLVYEMNDEPLPHAHGYPLRIYIPDRYGMKQPKWITRINAIDFESPGYWVDRGWSEGAFVVTTSVIDTNDAPFNVAEGDLFSLGGIAYSGAKGISKVEVKVDDGEWREAELRIPPLSPLTWVQWGYEWRVVPGSHSFQVRAYDAQGKVQIEESRPVRPDGATGIHSRRIRF